MWSRTSAGSTLRSVDKIKSPKDLSWKRWRLDINKARTDLVKNWNYTDSDWNPYAATELRPASWVWCMTRRSFGSSDLAGLTSKISATITAPREEILISKTHLSQIKERKNGAKSNSRITPWWRFVHSEYAQSPRWFRDEFIPFEPLDWKAIQARSTPNFQQCKTAYFIQFALVFRGADT